MRAVAAARRRSAAATSGRRASNSAPSPTGIGRASRNVVCRRAAIAGFAGIDDLDESVTVAQAVRERLAFQKSKADWVQERLKKGFEGDVEKLWETAQKQNTEAVRATEIVFLQKVLGTK